MTKLFLAAGFIAALPLIAVEKPQSEWVHPRPDGKLVYKTTPAGDRIMDFSSAGYMGGGVALPEVPVKGTVKPSGGEDDTAAIQDAINKVAALPLDGNFRGAVLLAPGNFTCSKTITIPTSGIVLRGSGGDDTTTTIKMTGSRHAAIIIGGGSNRRPANDEDGVVENDPAAKIEFTAAQTSVADAYVPAGASSFTVADVKGFTVGDTIAIRRPTTPAWVKFMQMDKLSRNGRSQTWIGSTRGEITERRITAISGNKVTVDIALADSYDAKYLNPPGTTVAKIRPARQTVQVGVEHLHIQCPPLEIAYGQAPYSAIRIGADDCWVKDVYCEETMNSTTLGGKRITMERVRVKHTYANLGASKPTDFSIEGSQILLDRCSISGGNMYFVWTTSLDPGPNVLLNCTFIGNGSRVQPHMRWSTGLLVDNCKVPDGGIDFMNRGVMGSGHGWTMAWAVAWNCTAQNYVIQNPPGAINWAIGCIGKRVFRPQPFDAVPNMPEGAFDLHGTPVAPQSLYLAQLAERLGSQAVKNIGYSTDGKELSSSEPMKGANENRIIVENGLGPDLALYRPVNAGNVRERKREFGGEKAVDGDDKTFWATDNGSTRPTLEVDLEGQLDINAIEIAEASGLENVEEYKVEAQVDSDWKLLYQGTTIGNHSLQRFPKVTAWKVRLTILKARAYPAIRKFSIYSAPSP